MSGGMWGCHYFTSCGCLTLLGSTCESLSLSVSLALSSSPCSHLLYCMCLSLCLSSRSFYLYLTFPFFPHPILFIAILHFYLYEFFFLHSIHHSLFLLFIFQVQWSQHALYLPLLTMDFSILSLHPLFTACQHECVTDCELTPLLITLIHSAVATV